METYESENTSNDHAEGRSAVDGSSAGEDWGASWGRAGNNTGGADSARGCWETSGRHDSSWGDGWLALVNGDGTIKLLGRGSDFDEARKLVDYAT